MSNQHLPRRTFLLRTATLGTLASSLAGMAAEAYPSRPIRIVVPVAPGGGTDIVARLVGEGLRAKLGQPVIIDNRAGGAGGTVGAEQAARAAPDGYTLLVAGAGPLATHNFLYPKIGFKPLDFAPISLISVSPNMIVTSANSRFRTFAEFIAEAKAKPGTLFYATGGAGNSAHMAMEHLKSLAGIDVEHVPYKGGAAAATGLLQGQADVMVGEVSTVLMHIKAGTMRALAGGGESRLPLLPDVPTISETVPGFVAIVWFGLAAPPKTPAEITEQLSAATVAMLKQPDVAAKMRSMNLEPLGTTPAQMAKFVRQEADRWGKVIRAARITAE